MYAIGQGGDSDLGGGSLRGEHVVAPNRDVEAHSENKDVSWERAVVCLPYDNGSWLAQIALPI